MGLLLGARERTGRLVWQLPHAANLTLRRFGTVLLLAGIGTKAGQSFSHTVTSPAAASIVIAGAVVTVVMVAVTVLAGASAHAAEEDDVLAGYATVYPLVMIVKIVAVQLLITLLA